MIWAEPAKQSITAMAAAAVMATLTFRLRPGVAGIERYSRSKPKLPSNPNPPRIAAAHRSCSGRRAMSMVPQYNSPSTLEV